ncbi:MAG: hypothetical protein KA603_14195 [Azonexus sp.]|jgi:hypothetical protein|nr:hypothetical protein [Betaproteobacteria bacterium]MBK8919403.1 hypothetical protein [Betaproteobacteria bacterium]MBP6037274.1 hypothetical protein [Azonexus sp.]MBP6907817.1 hypothetical protein [Azonexus sp.]
MAHDQNNTNDPLNFVRGMWGNMGFSLPGMVAPTFDEEELEQRISDLKTVEGWLRMNLSMLQMTIQGLEMQKTTITAVKAVGTMASNAMHAGTPEAGSAPAPQDDAASQAALWPWTMMQQMQEHLQNQADAIKTAAPAPAPKKPRPRRSPKA